MVANLIEMNFVTLFDQSYMPQGLVLIESLKRHNPKVNVWVIAIDDETNDLLSRINYRNVEIVRARDIASRNLKDVSNQRSLSEYCWTVKPFAVSEVFRRNASLESLVYIDANMYLMRSFTEAWMEFQDTLVKAIIVRHAFAPEYDQTEISGEYCSSLIFFNREALHSILPDWEESCLNWCGDTPSMNRFGDQKYLESWSNKFQGEVRTYLGEKHFGAPWNVSKRNVDELIAFKFQSLRILDDEKILLSESYNLSQSAIRELYQPYCLSVLEKIQVIKSHGGSWSSRQSTEDRRRVRAFAIALAKGRLGSNSPYIFDSSRISRLRSQ